VPGAAELRLSGDSRIGVGRSTGVSDHPIRTDTSFTLQRFRYYHGARAASGNGSAEYRIVDVRSAKAVFLDGSVHPDAHAAKLATDFPAGSWFEIYDYGVGDEVVWPFAVSVTLQPSGEYRITAPVDVKADLPHRRSRTSNVPGTCPLQRLVDRQKAAASRPSE